MDGERILGQLNLVVRDMDATVAFYRRLGLAVGHCIGRRRHPQTGGRQHKTCEMLFP